MRSAVEKKYMVVLLLLVLVRWPWAMTLNEIMYNPDGDEDLNEFIELYNDGQFPVPLLGWRITDGEDTNTVIEANQGLTATPGQYVLILDPDYFDEDGTIYNGRIPSDALVLTIDNSEFGGRGLSNTNPETISLINPQGQAESVYIHSVGNPNGFSDEKIIPTGDNSRSNWATSRVFGGTPGAQNSVTPPNHDLGIVRFDYVPHDADPGENIQIMITVENLGRSAEDDSVLLFVQNTMHSDSLQRLSGWFTGMLNPHDSINFNFDWLWTNDESAVLVAELLSGDDRPANDVWRIALGTSGLSGWIVINEIMYRPESQRTEWVELLNGGAFTWNISGWTFGDGTSIMDSTRRMQLPDAFLLPGDYLVLAQDSSIFYEQIPPAVPVVIWNSKPITLNNSGDSLVLYDVHDQLVDRVDYRPSWGDGIAGRSLERISSNALSNDPLNWATSLDSTGGTPGRMNSRSTQPASWTTDLLVLEPNPFSPDGDGHEDLLTVKFRLDNPDSRLDLRIFDIRGREVRRLANNESASYAGERYWDGKDGSGRDLPTGIYIVYLEALGKGGTRIQTAKRVVALARPS